MDTHAPHMWVLIRCGPCRKIHGFCRFVSLKSKRNLQGSSMEGGKLPRCLHLKVLSTSSNGKTFNLPDHVWHSSVPRTLSPTVNDIIGIKAQVLKTGSEILYRGARFVECREMRNRSISWSDYVCKEKNRKKNKHVDFVARRDGGWEMSQNYRTLGSPLAVPRPITI